MLRSSAVTVQVLLAVTLVVANPLEVLESSFRRISPPAQASSGRAFQDGGTAPYEILEQSFKFKNPGSHDMRTFTSAIRSRITENHKHTANDRKMSPHRFTSLRTTNAPLSIETLTTKPPTTLERTSTTKQPSRTTPVLVRLAKTSTKPSSSSSPQTTPFLGRSTSLGRVTSPTSSRFKVLKMRSEPFNSKRLGNATKSHLTRPNYSPPSPRRLVDTMKPLRLQSHFRFPTSVKQKRPTFVTGSMMINGNKDLISAPSPAPETVKSIRDLVENLDDDLQMKSKFNTPPTISPTSSPDAEPLTWPMLKSSLPAIKITTAPGHTSTSEGTSTESTKLTETDSLDSQKRNPGPQGHSSSSSTRVQFEDVRPGEVNILTFPFSTLNTERNTKKNEEKNLGHTWKVISTGSKNPVRYILQKRPMETSFFASPTLKQKHQSDPIQLSQNFPVLIQAVKDSIESLTTPKVPKEFAEQSKFSNYAVVTQSPEDSVHSEDNPSVSVQDMKTFRADDSNSKFLAQSSEQDLHPTKAIVEEKNPVNFDRNKDFPEEVDTKTKTTVKQKKTLLNDVFRPQEEFPEKINGLEDMSPTGIITYYEKLKHDIYDILNQLQENQHLEAHKLSNKDQFETEEDELPSITSKPTLNFNYGEEQETPKIDIERVLTIMRNFKARTSAEEVPESTLHDIAESIIKYINEKEKQSSIKLSYEAEDKSHHKYRPTYGAPPLMSDRFEYDYQYVYYDDLGNEYLPEDSNLYDKNKIISPSDEFTQAFLAKHTSKLSAMLTEVLQNAANDKATVINPLEFLATKFGNVSTTTQISPTLTPQVNSIFTPFKQRPLSENSPFTTESLLEVDVTSTTSYSSQAEEISLTGPTSTTETTTSEIPPTTTNMTETTKILPRDSPFSDTQKRKTATTSASNIRLSSSTVGSNTRWSSIGPASSPNRKKNKFSQQSSQLFGQRRPQSTNVKVKYDKDKSNEEKEVLPHPGAGNTALETLAGAGAVALMAYGISYALPLAAPLVLRRSGSSRESPISRLMNWLDISRSNGKKKKRKGVKVFKNTPGYPIISIRNSSVLEPLNYDDYDDDYHTDYYEFGKTGQKISTKEDYDVSFEDIPTRYRNDFKGTIRYEDSAYPFPSKFNHMARLDTSSATDKKIEERASDIRSPVKHVGSDFYSFGYDPTDGTIGDDPPNESAVFGKVTYEYDFTNTYINPAVVGAEVPSNYDAFPTVQNRVGSKGEIPVRGTLPQGGPIRTGVPVPPRSERKPKPPQSSSFLSNIFGNIFSPRSSTGNVNPPIASKRIPQNFGPTGSSRVQQHGPPRTIVKSSENTNFPHRSVEVVNRVPPRNLPLRFSHSGASRIPTGVRPRIDGELYVKEGVARKDDIAVGGGGFVLSSELSKIGGGGISLPSQSVSSINTRTKNKNTQYPSYVSLEQVNRLAEEEMEGVVRGYSQRYDAPWPPPEGSKIMKDNIDMTGAGSKVYLFDETDLKQGYHLNADSTDYIYKTRDNSYTNSPLSHGVETKPATLRTLSPDYKDFDYVDIKGSSVDFETKRSFAFSPASSQKE
ncbi:hypothetical protein FHG87_009825 [Trinorchestia longiramus]|nr:hypothetical protein FHG87_009825 [Trinorchestia longiramus]